MKKSILIILASIFLSYPTNLIGADFETTHEFSAGDTISADMMNEIYKTIMERNRSATALDLVGSWSCNSFASYGNLSNAVSGWSAGGENHYIQLSNATITFINDGDGTFSFTTSSPQPFYVTYNSADTTAYTVVSDTLIFKLSDWGSPVFYAIRKISSTRMVFDVRPSASSSGSYVPRFLTCDKQNLPPNTPSTFTASASGKTVSLAWTDNSADETGFKVLRRDSLEGSFSTVTTTSADATSYDDTVTAAGSYWYRVSATSSNGDSTGSKVVKVDVE